MSYLRPHVITSRTRSLSAPQPPEILHETQEKPKEPPEFHSIKKSILSTIDPVTKWSQGLGIAHSMTVKSQARFRSISSPVDHAHPNTRPKSKSRGKTRSRSRSNSENTSFNIYDKRVSWELQEAFDAIFGMPFRGSIAFIGVVGGGFNLYKCRMKQRFTGSVKLDVVITNPKICSKRTKISVYSAGHCDGNKAELKINDREVGKNEKGINLALYFPLAQVVKSAVFDTHGINGAAETERMIAFVTSNCPFISVDSSGNVLITGNEHVIVLFGAKDEISKNLGTKGKRFLSGLGMSIPLADDLSRVEPLIKTGALPAEKTPSLLSVCAKANATRIATALYVSATWLLTSRVENKWRIDYRPNHGLRNTALHDAIFHDSEGVVQLLLKSGASIHIRNKMGETAEEMLLAKGPSETSKKLLDLRNSLEEKEGDDIPSNRVRLEEVFPVDYEELV